MRQRKCIVTGASSGIGKEVVAHLLANNDLVIGADLTLISTENNHPNLTSVYCDVSDVNQVDQLFSFAIDKFGSIDIFVANAGFAYYEVQKPDWHHIQSIMSTNVASVFYSANRLKLLCDDAPFHFIAISSAMADCPLPGYALYSATKAAIKGFAQAYRHELSNHQYFQVVYPIATQTNFFKVANNSPKPWPTQTATHVAKCIFRATYQKRRHIYPSKTFMIIQRFFPFILWGYVAIESKKFKAFFQSKTPS